MKQQVLLGQASAAGLLLVVSSLFYSRVFEGPGWIIPIVAGTLVSGLLALLLTRTSLNRVVRGAVLLVLGLLFLGLTVLLPGTNFGTSEQLLDALVGSTLDGWRNALAATLPIETSAPEPIGFATTLAWLAGAVTGSALGRPEGTAGVIVPGVTFAALSLPLAAPTGVASYVFIAGLVAAALLVSLVRAIPQSKLGQSSDERVTEFIGERLLSERLAAGAPVLLVLALVVPLIATVFPFGNEEPFDPRQLRQAEEVTSTATNPLAIMKAQREAAVPAFTLDLPAAPAAEFFDRVTLVALENYDGVTWSTDATYSATSADISGIETPFQSIEVRQNYELLEAESPWLPAGGNVTNLQGDDIWFDEVSGTFLDLSGGEVVNYSVLSNVIAPTTEELEAATVDLSDLRYTNTGIDIPGDSPITTLTTQVDGANTYQQLLSLEAFLREERTLVNEAASGTALGRINEFLIDDEGYRDQFVTAFALAARQQGIPTRIAVGYRITQVNEDSTEVFLDTVTTEQYDAWPEVRFEGIGWVPFDPVPVVSGEAGATDDNATQIPEGQPAPSGPTPQEADPTEDDNLEDPEEAVSPTIRVLIVSGTFLLVFPILLILLIVLAKLIRRRHRENLIDPTDRVLAGWQESKDRLLEAGVEIRPDMTVKEIVSTSRRELGVHASSSLSALAPYVTTTIYSDRQPDEATADNVWREVDSFDRQLGDTRSFGQNVKARIDPRPLLEKV